MTDPGSVDPDATLMRLLGPAFREAIGVLEAGPPDAHERERLASLLADAAEAAQRELGEHARDPRIHLIVGSAASSAMALSLGDDVVPLADVLGRLRKGRQLLSAGSRSPEDQDPAE
ncbi:hypothetical protein [Leifsonia sp. 2MCAF36]|uniref:hypothetical protein n=1 Tax=Leifsonia sp. 2MCAF36 TaxID=3232988 RepID=UPI003F9AB616